MIETLAEPAGIRCGRRSLPDWLVQSIICWPCKITLQGISDSSHGSHREAQNTSPSGSSSTNAKRHTVFFSFLSVMAVASLAVRAAAQQKHA